VLPGGGPRPAAAVSEVIARMAIGTVPGWGIAAVVAIAYLALFSVAALAGRGRGGDEVHGVEQAIEHWTS